MDRTAFAAAIDHTVLGPETTPGDVERVVSEAAKYGMNACVPPCYLDVAREAAPDVTLATVVGFPHGQHAPETKLDEAVGAWERARTNSTSSSTSGGSTRARTRRWPTNSPRSSPAFRYR